METIKRMEIIIDDGRTITRKKIEVRTIVIVRGGSAGSGYVANDIIAKAKRAAEEHFSI